MEILIGIMVYVIAVVILEVKVPEIGQLGNSIIALFCCGVFMFLVIALRER